MSEQTKEMAAVVVIVAVMWLGMFLCAASTQPPRDLSPRSRTFWALHSGAAH